MQKRVISFLLSAAILFGLFCGMAPSVRAASNMTSSDACIEIIKELEGFSKYPYYDNGQYSVGYGTACSGEDYERYKAEGISEEEAEELLREFVSDFESSLNTFINKYGLSLKQHQFDGLLSFTYNLGPSWMNSASTFRSAVLDGATGNDFVFAIARWCTASGKVLTALIERRLIEANMYLNGVYKSEVPSNYNYVIFDDNLDGATNDVRVQAYDTNTPDSIRSKPTASGYTFLGWYTEATGGTRVTTLDADTSVTTLYAHWKSGSDDSADDTGTVIATGVITATKLNVRSGAGSGYSVVDYLYQGDEVEIYETKTVDGVTWGRISWGWISMEYVDLDTGSDADEDGGEPEMIVADGVVTATKLYIRSGAGTGYSSVGYYIQGDEVDIYETKTVDGVIWGRTDLGWISLEYVDFDLDAPVVSVSNVASSGKVKLTWDAVDEAVKYKIYRSTKKSSGYKLLKTTTATSFVNTSAAAGTKYYYYVKAVACNNGSSDASNKVVRTCDLARPAISLSNVASSGKIKISWNAVDGAVSYQVYRSSEKNGEYSLLKTTTATSMTNTTAEAGNVYYYKVKAVANNSAANSAFSTAKYRTCDLPRPSIKLSNVASTGKIRVTWDAVEGAAGYEVYRATSKNGTYKLLKTVTGTSFTNTAAVAGKTYYYKVVALAEKSAADSAYSAAKYRTCDLAQPEVSAALTDAGKPRVTWNAVEGAVEYQVYRSTSENGTYKLLKTTTATAFTNTAFESNTTYYYQVVAVASASAANSAASAAVSVTTN